MEFGKLSLAELAALEEAQIERDKREDWRCAMIVATILNVNRTKETKAFTPESIMPWLRKSKGKSKQSEKQTAEQMRETLAMVTRAFGGVVRRDRVPLDAEKR